MTRIEAAYKICPSLKGFISPEELIRHSCPHDLFAKIPKIDEETEVISQGGITIGCRGKTCKQCWNAEAKE